VMVRCVQLSFLRFHEIAYQPGQNHCINFVD
jgi:hypothetical protein